MKQEKKKKSKKSSGDDASVDASSIQDVRPFFL